MDKNKYVATFHTHVSALKTNKNMEKAGINSKINPVPRKLSSSCGSCIYFESKEPNIDLLDDDTESLYLIKDDDYTLIWKGEF